MRYLGKELRITFLRKHEDLLYEYSMSDYNDKSNARPYYSFKIMHEGKVIIKIDKFYASDKEDLQLKLRQYLLKNNFYIIN